MTLNDLRNTFAQGTEFYLVNPENDVQALKITSLLWGNSGFASMEVVNVQADYNKLRIWTVIPKAVWQAWFDYSNDYYTKEGR